MGDPSGLVTAAMIAEQRALEAEETAREEREAAAMREKLRREGVRSSALSKLDVLLEKTSIFADSLLQQMEDITLVRRGKAAGRQAGRQAGSRQQAAGRQFSQAGSRQAGGKQAGRQQAGRQQAGISGRQKAGRQAGRR